MAGSPTKPPSPANDSHRKVLVDVREHGWHVVKIMATGEAPDWAFSVGLFHSFSQPEIIVVGLPLDVMHGMINGVGELIAEGEKFSNGACSSDVVEGYSCAFSRVAPCWYEPLLGYAAWFYRGHDFPVLQCEWPDRNGLLPDDPRFEPALRAVQPVLRHRDAKTARMEALLDSFEDEHL